jgi:hypothetical protein
MTITQESVDDILSNCGFVREPGKPGHLFLVEAPGTVTPAFYSMLFRRRGEAHLGGGVGLFFREFEKMWSDSLSREERRIDATLPLGMLIDNYLELIDAGTFRYSGLEGIEDAGRRIYDFTRRLPASPEAFDKALSEGKLLGKPVSDYLHIRGYNEDDDLYFRKSVSFVHWFIETFPQFAGHLRQCLTGSQLRRLGLG